MWQRGIGLLLLLLLLTTAYGTPSLSAQDTCDGPVTLAAGYWTGSFEVDWRVRWTADLGLSPLSDLPRAPAVWEASRSIRGEIDLLVRETEQEGVPAVEGTARALWRESTTATREDGGRMSRSQRGWLTAGALVVPAGRTLAPGDTIEWSGAWWTGPVPEEEGDIFTSGGVVQAPDGRELFIDGGTPAEPAQPLRFQLTATCRPITGTADPALFGYPELGPEVGIETVSANATLRLRWRSAE